MDMRTGSHESRTTQAISYSIIIFSIIIDLNRHNRSKLEHQSIS